MNSVYVIGGSQTDFERNWSKEGKGVIALLKEVINDGLEDSNITLDDIKKLNNKKKIGCFVGNFNAECYIKQSHLGALLTEVDEAFYGVPCARYEAACASGSVALDAAITKIKAGEIDVAMVIGFELMKTVSSVECGDYLGQAAFYEEESEGIEFPFPKLFGRLADETIKKYNLDEERYLKNLATIACINYENAKKNSNAQTRNWFMNEKQANSRGIETNELIGGKIAISDCSQVTDGASMIILVSKKYIQEKKLDNIYPIVKGYGHTVAPMKFDKKITSSMESEYILPFTRQAVVDAYERANMRVEDIDFFETHDCFTSSEYVAISSFGITNPGEEYKAIENGVIRLDGEKPINPSGGLIGCGHPVGASGVRMFYDLYKQIMNKAGHYQVKKHDNGMMLNIGGSATTNYTFIIGRE